MNRKNIRLKRCPCCGGKPYFEDLIINTDYYSYYYALRISCDCGLTTESKCYGRKVTDGESHGVEMPEKDAVNKLLGIWNNRIKK